MLKTFLMFFIKVFKKHVVYVLKNSFNVFLFFYVFNFFMLSFYF